MKHYNEGYSLVEMVVSLSIFSFISIILLQFFVQAHLFSDKIVVKQQLMENSRVVLAFIETTIKEGREYKLYTQKNGSLSLLLVNTADTDDGSITAFIYEDFITDPQHNYYQTVRIGGSSWHDYNRGAQKLADGISNVQISIDDGLMYISITTAGYYQGVEVEPLVLDKVLDVRHLFSK